MRCVDAIELVRLAVEKQGRREDEVCGGRRVLEASAGCGVAGVWVRAGK